MVLALAAAGLLAACNTSVPAKHRKSGGGFSDWNSYEKKGFYPSRGKVQAIDASAGTVTILQGAKPKTYKVTAATRVMHEGDDIKLSDLPLDTAVKFNVGSEPDTLSTLWYGKNLTPVRASAPRQEDRNTFF